MQEWFVMVIRTISLDSSLSVGLFVGRDDILYFSAACMGRSTPDSDIVVFCLHVVSFSL